MEIKEVLHRQLKFQREALLWKAEGLGERDLRLPRTHTGTNLLGLVKHCLGVEHGYFIESFGRTSGLQLPDNDYERDPNSDLYATEAEGAQELIQLYRDVASAVDAAIEDMSLEQVGRVPWWGERGETTLGIVLVHVVGEIARHAGHADVVREGIDGQAGWKLDNSNLWEPDGGWDTHVLRLTSIAESFAG